MTTDTDTFDHARNFIYRDARLLARHITHFDSDFRLGVTAVVVEGDVLRGDPEAIRSVPLG